MRWEEKKQQTSHAGLRGREPKHHRQSRYQRGVHAMQDDVEQMQRRRMAAGGLVTQEGQGPAKRPRFPEELVVGGEAGQREVV